MSEWRVGDLAIVTTRDGSEYAAIYTLAPGIDYFWAAIGDRPGNAMVNPDVSARRLVVIDPEDRAQVERLIRVWGQQFDSWTPEPTGTNADRMQAALREFAQPQPVKPEEPTGLGAVVEDADGKVFVRGPSSSAPLDIRADWVDAIGGFFKWSELAAVRVLSEGVTE